MRSPFTKGQPNKLHYTIIKCGKLFDRNTLIPIILLSFQCMVRFTLNYGQLIIEKKRLKNG